MQEMQVQYLDQKEPLEKEWQSTPVFLPGKYMDRGAWCTTVYGVEKSQIQFINWTATIT